ncbi:MAG: type I methionyl aminopeptidase [Candidatus Omnitrophota bacterium]
MIAIKSKNELKKIRNACQITALVIDKLKKQIKPGISTKDLEKIAKKEIDKFGALAAFFGYRGFPGYICTSVNEVVVHGIPDKKCILEAGDILSIDVGVKADGYYGDAAITTGVGTISQEAQRLIDVTYAALLKGIEEIRPEIRLSNISAIIQNFVEKNAFSVVREFVGHGIGVEMHEEPQIPNFGRPERGPRLKPGMVLALEPMVNMGAHEVEILNDGWTAVTRDRKLSAHFEHTIAVTEKGAEILTQIDRS